MTQPTIDTAALRALIQKVQDEQADLGDLITLSHLQFDQLAELLDLLDYWKIEYEAALANWQAHIETDKQLNAEIVRLRGAIREALPELEFIRDNYVGFEDLGDDLRAALEAGEGE